MRTGYPESRFGPQHGLTPEQAWQAERLYQRVVARDGPYEGWKAVQRLSGILSAVKRGLVGNRRWGVRMFHRRGGLARRDSRAGPSLRELAEREAYKRYASAELRRLRALGKEAMFDPIRLKAGDLTETARRFGVPWRR